MVRTAWLMGSEYASMATGVWSSKWRRVQRSMVGENIDDSYESEGISDMHTLMHVCHDSLSGALTSTRFVDLALHLVQVRANSGFVRNLCNRGTQTLGCQRLHIQRETQSKLPHAPGCHPLLHHLRDDHQRHAKGEAFHRTIHAAVAHKNVCLPENLQLRDMRREDEVRWRFLEGRKVDPCTKRKYDLPLSLTKGIEAQVIELGLIVEGGSERNVELGTLPQAFQGKIAAVITLRLQRGSDEHKALIKGITGWLESAREKDDVQIFGIFSERPQVNRFQVVGFIQAGQILVQRGHTL